jgi:hypothetical protein
VVRLFYGTVFDLWGQEFRVARVHYQRDGVMKIDVLELNKSSVIEYLMKL